MASLDDLSVFTRVVERQSFSAVARDFKSTKSAISKQVSRLERRLGAKLLNRSTRRLSLTEIGALVFDHSTRIADEVEAIEAVVAGLQSTPRGTLRITASVPFGQRHVVRWLPEFCARYPELDVRAHLNDRYIDLVEEGFDAAIRLTSSPPPSAVARKLAPIRYVLCASKAYVKKAGTPKSPAALKDHNCIVFDRNESDAQWRFIKGGEQTKIKARGTLSVNSSDAIREAVLQGHGIALLPTYVVGDDLRSGKLLPLLKSYEAIGGFGDSVYAVYLPSRFQTPKVRAFVDFMMEKFGDEPYWDRKS